MAPLLHRAAIKKEETTGQKYNGLPYYIGDHNKASTATILYINIAHELT